MCRCRRRCGLPSSATRVSAWGQKRTAEFGLRRPLRVRSGHRACRCKCQLRAKTGSEPPSRKGIATDPGASRSIVHARKVKCQGHEPSEFHLSVAAAAQRPLGNLRLAAELREQRQVVGFEVAPTASLRPYRASTRANSRCDRGRTGKRGPVRSGFGPRLETRTSNRVGIRGQSLLYAIWSARPCALSRMSSGARSRRELSDRAQSWPD